MWLQMRQVAEVSFKTLHAKLGNLVLILQPKEGCCKVIYIWHICLGETPETERKENWQSYELSSIYISSKTFPPQLNKMLPTEVCPDDIALE